MIDENVLRAKFFLAPKDTTYEQLLKMNEKYTKYPCLTVEQAEELNQKILSYKTAISSNNKNIL